ncbi:hypothetical protein PoB_001754700 [Plakobranchus ocellatus]|uniref:Uncharacterized protein n=1 Tax=Plakobranchus ocellatus TaxID=259542 RepID=A0AAV3Z939_9GAST|nr:hypothetical protein PoB_001754700 [Plakobranchus ocellatus]
MPLLDILHSSGKHLSCHSVDPDNTLHQANSVDTASVSKKKKKKRRREEEDEDEDEEREEEDEKKKKKKKKKEGDEEDEKENLFMYAKRRVAGKAKEADTEDLHSRRRHTRYRCHRLLGMSCPPLPQPKKKLF